MRVLVLTTTQPSASVNEKQGISWRLGLFVDAFGKLDASITMAHFVLPSVIEANPDLAAFGRLQSDYWGWPVEIRLLPRRSRRETPFNHYVAGMARVQEQPPIQSFAGEEQARAVATLLDAEHWDVVFVQGLAAMAALLRAGRRSPVTFFDLNDVEHKARLRWCLQRPL